MRRKLFVPVLLLMILFIPFIQAQQAVTIDLNTRYQKMEGFGASDAWCGDFLGKYWTTARETAARWIFSQNFDKNGDPFGIGLSLWRFNIGAGTATQDNIYDLAARTECMLNEDGTYDWTKQSGQVWMIEKAKEYGCDKIVAFSNSPPIYFTKNGKGFADPGGSANLQEDKYDDFAEYLATVAEYFEKEKGIKIDHISPVNEPQWGWDGNRQEGSPWRNAEIAKLVKELDKSIVKRGISSKIHIAEAGAWDYYYTRPVDENGLQAYAFWGENSPYYIGDLPSVAPVLAGHDYWTHGSNQTMESVRKRVYTTACYYNLTPAATEWCLLGDPPQDGFPDSYEKATNTDIALLMAKIIYSDMVHAQANSWNYWTMFAPGDPADLSRYILMCMRNNTGSLYESGTLSTYKQFWALGNYSLFIRPEYQRIELLGASDLATLMGSAYVAPDTSRVVAVYVNMSYAEQKIKPELTSLGDYKVSKVMLYRTNSTLNLKNMRIPAQYTPQAEVKIPARSITTMIYDLDRSLVSNAQIKQDNALGIYPNPIVNGHFTLQLPSIDNQTVSLTLSSMDGKKVYYQQLSDELFQEITLPESVGKGLFLLSLNTNTNQWVSKIEVSSKAN